MTLNIMKSQTSTNVYIDGVEEFEVNEHNKGSIDFYHTELKKWFSIQGGYSFYIYNNIEVAAKGIPVLEIEKVVKELNR